MKKVNLLLIAFLFLFLKSYGQSTISGKVTSLYDNSPLSGVSVVAVCTFPVNVSTKSDGTFTMVVIDKVTSLKFAKKGYKSIEVPLTSSVVNVQMEVNPNVLKGLVICAADSLPIVGVKIKFDVIGGESIYSDSSGRFSIEIPQKGKRLHLSHPKMKNKTISFLVPLTDSVVSFELEPVATNDNKIINTGYEIILPAKSYSSSHHSLEFKGVSEKSQANLNYALAGKIAGLKVNGQSEMALNRVGSINLRGQNGISTGQSAIYVVDGLILSNIIDLNLEDIDNINVLSGPNSAAIYGSRGSNGVIIVTTKKGKLAQKSLSIDINSSVKVSSVYIMPQYQNSYAGGYGSELTRYDWQPHHPVEWQPLDGKYYHDYWDDVSWGPKMVGQEYIPWYSWYSGIKYTGKTAKLNPQPDNVRDFYNTGITSNINAAISKSGNDHNIYLFLGNTDTKGLIPNSSVNKTSLGLRFSLDLNKKLSVGANINLSISETRGEFDDSYHNASTGSFNQGFHRDLDMGILKELQGLENPLGSYATWNHGNPDFYYNSGLDFYYSFWHNPFDYFELNNTINNTNNIYGNISAKYNFSDYLSTKITYRRQQDVSKTEEMYDYYLPGFIGWQSYYEENGRYSKSSLHLTSENFESLVTFNKKISSIDVSTSFGTDFNSSTIENNYASTQYGLIIPNLYTINNSRSQPSIKNSTLKEKNRALFIIGNVSYNEFLSLDFTLRNDWNSALPPNKNSLLSKSVGGNIIFTKIVNIPFVGFGKIRASWGQIPTTIGVNTYPGISYGVHQYPWGGHRLMITSDYFVDPTIQGAVISQKEIGVDLSFLDNKISLSVTYWGGNEKGIPYTIPITPFSGYTSMLTNSGEISKKGFEFILGIVPLSYENFQWELNATLGYLRENRVVKIADGIDQITVQSMWYSKTPHMIHEKGKPWGQLYGSGVKKINGKPVFEYDSWSNSYSFVNEPKTYFGSVLPKITGGIQNSIHFLKRFSCNISLDYQVGGKFFSLSQMWGTYSGLTARTVGVNDKGNSIRTPVVDGGGIHLKGVDRNQNPVDFYIEAQTYFSSFYNQNVYDVFINDASFVKLRELSVEYSIPIQKMKFFKGVSNATISIFALNPWLIYAKQKDFDPSELSRISGEQGQFPSVRSFGTNLKITF
ncbi:MAG: SusC/RagA family TonB-linked outer membrane protein [Tenuifilaceae bacterium]